MSEEKHTPGPWLIEGNTIYSLMHYGWHKGIELFKNRFSFRVYFDSSCSQEEIEATKQLIAAAPDLLDALVAVDNALRTAWSNGSLPDSVIPADLAQQCRAAIAKAKKAQT